MGEERKNMKVRKGNIVAVILLVIAILVLTVTTTTSIWNHITKGLDLQGGFEVLYEAAPEKGQKVTSQVLKDAANALTKRVDILGVTEPEVSIESSDRIRVQLAGVKDQEKARDLLGKPAQISFRDPTGKQKLLKGDELQEGGAGVDYDENGAPVIVLKLKDAKKFADITRRYLGQPLPIFLDDKLLSAPTIRQVIPTGTATISGQKNYDEAKELADLLNAGAIPIKLVEKQSFAVDASLGQEALKDSLLAGLYAILAIFIFVIGYYRLPGLIAVITLIAYSYLVLLAFMLLKVTLTLAGIAAFILGIGIAVDANIIMAERIRDEIRLGKSIPASVRMGSKRSFLTIFDAHVTTIIAATVLFYYGTASVRGFSVSLLVGILMSFVTAVALSRIMMTLLIRSNLIRHPKLFNVREDEISEL